MRLRERRPVPATMGEAFAGLAAVNVIRPELAVRLRRAVGFRNIAVHNYEAMDWEIVFALTGEPLADFDQFAAAVAVAALA